MSLFQDLDPTRWEELGRNPVALLSEMSLDVARRAHRRSRAGAPDQPHLPAAPGVPRAIRDVGRHARRHPPPPAGGLLLGRVRHPRIAADLLRRARRAGRRPHQERLRSRRAARRRRPVLRSGLLSATARRQAAGSRRTTPRSTSPGCRSNRPWGRTARRLCPRSRRATAPCARVCGRRTVGRRTLLLLDSDVDGNTPEDRALTARLYGGDVRVRIRQELLLGIGGLKALHALGLVPGVLPPQRGAQRLCGAGGHAPVHRTRGRRLRDRRPAGGPADRLHHPHARCPRDTTDSRPT